MVLSRLGVDRDGERGAVAIIVAVFAVVMFGLASLVVDLGMARDTRREAQNAADASALAAVGALYANGPTPDFTTAMGLARSYASANFGTGAADWAACNATSPLAYAPVTSCISFDSATAPTRVRVVIPSRWSPSAFGGVVGYDGLAISALADAKLDSTSIPVCAFCVLGSGSHDLQNGNLVVQDGDLWINGSLNVGSNGQVSAGTTYVAGTASPANKVTGALVQNSTVVTDPLAGMTMPTTTGLPLRTDPCTQGPGRYGSVSISGSGTCTLTPGLYVFTDTLSIGGTKTFAASGVTLYFACGASGTVGSCSSDGTPGNLDQGGSGGFTVTAPTTGATKGLAIVYARDNPAQLYLHGSGNFTLTGTVYAPAATFVVRGGSCITPQQTWVVVSDVQFAGNGACFNTRYATTQNVDLPPSSPGLVL
jgi:Flp pilus assembly protein TadG